LCGLLLIILKAVILYDFMESNKRARWGIGKYPTGGFHLKGVFQEWYPGQ
jgi:hypothetical protein